MALALVQNVLSFAVSTTGSLLYIGFGATCTLNHYLGLGYGTAAAGYIAHWAYNDNRKNKKHVYTALASALVSMPLSFLIGYGVPYILVPTAFGVYLLYLAGEIEVKWTPNEKNQEKIINITIEKNDESDYIEKVMQRVVASGRNEPGLIHKYSDADLKRIPDKEFMQIWIDFANGVDKRFRSALREVDRADQAAEVAKKVADLGIVADVQEDNTGQFVVYTGVSDPARRNEIESNALTIFEGGAVEEDNDGQFVIYTGIGGEEKSKPTPELKNSPIEAEPDSPVASPPVVVPEPTEAPYGLRSRNNVQSETVAN